MKVGQMLSCKETMRLVSMSLDRRLSWPEWLGMRMHLSMCRFCARVHRQMRFLRAAARRFQEGLPEIDDLRLSPAARQRIRAALFKP